MAAVSNILRETSDNGLIFHCPGCNTRHIVHHGEGKEPRWVWNGDVDKPTFSPSVLVRSGNEKGTTICHSFVTDGMIKFLDDSNAPLSRTRGTATPLDWR